jgi:hypothetical protein
VVFRESKTPSNSEYRAMNDAPFCNPPYSFEKGGKSLPCEEEIERNVNLSLL